MDGTKLIYTAIIVSAAFFCPVQIYSSAQAVGLLPTMVAFVVANVTIWAAFGATVMIYNFFNPSEG